MKKKSMKKVPDRLPKYSFENFSTAIKYEYKTGQQETEHWNMAQELLVQRIRNSG